MRVALVKASSNVIVAATEEDRVKLRAVKAGEAFVVRFGKPRSIERHRQFYACVSFIWKRHPDYRRFPDVEPLVEALKIATDHCVRWTIESTGEVLVRTKSIAFTELDEGEFLAWVAKAKPYMLELLEQFPPRTQARYSDEIDSWTHWLLH